MKWHGPPVPLDEAKRRALEYGRANAGLQPASFFADAIWPGHQMTAQGAGAAASRILKRLEKEGRAGWRAVYHRGESRSRWGWWAR